jgi:uncharacterized protein YjbI with pentapeptide repeats
MIMEKVSRREVEAEIERARVADASSNPIPEGTPYPTSEDIEPQLNNKDMSGEDLSGLDLSNANLSYSNLRETDCARTSLVMAELHHADLRGTRMDATDLRAADLRYTELQGADLSGAILEGDDPPLGLFTGPLDLYEARYDNKTRWPRGFEPEDYGARRVGVN